MNTSISDDRKLSALAYLLAALVILSVAYNIASERLVPGIEGYIRRKAHYEGVISKKGLSEHKASYWKSVDEAL